MRCQSLANSTPHCQDGQRAIVRSTHFVFVLQSSVLFGHVAKCMGSSDDMLFQRVTKCMGSSSDMLLLHAVVALSS